jgi:hypothetical protein
MIKPTIGPRSRVLMERINQHIEKQPQDPYSRRGSQREQFWNDFIKIFPVRIQSELRQALLELKILPLE